LPTTITRHKRTSRRQLTVYQRHELVSGRIFYPQNGYTGYGDGVRRDLSVFISEDMKLDYWANRTMLLEWWASGESEGHFPPPVTPPWLNAHGNPDTLPWACQYFEDDLDAVRRELRALARSGSNDPQSRRGVP
jgi:hypothetical protein